ncbi:MAG: hypothetical protein EPN26_10740 [Rhodospirillales bacterium]|nr:MAG: hypothetical protein EPN26_10740 [Rhodospirillales bacterium]
MRKIRVGVFAGLACLLAIAGQARAEPPQRTVEDVEFEVIETGFDFVSCCSSAPSVTVVGNWLSADLFAFNAQRDVPDANRKQLDRAILFDVRTKTAATLVAEGGIQCWNPERQIASISPHRASQNRRLMRLDTEGKLTDLAERPDLDDFYCWPLNLDERLTGVPGFRGGGLHLRDSDGYIPYKLPGQKQGPDLMAVWLRPDKPPLTLPIRREEIDGGRAPYLERVDIQDSHGLENLIERNRWRGIGV